MKSQTHLMAERERYINQSEKQSFTPYKYIDMWTQHSSVDVIAFEGVEKIACRSGSQCEINYEKSILFLFSFTQSISFIPIRIPFVFDSKQSRRCHSVSIVCLSPNCEHWVNKFDATSFTQSQPPLNKTSAVHFTVCKRRLSNYIKYSCQNHAFKLKWTQFFSLSLSIVVNVLISLLHIFQFSNVWLNETQSEIILFCGKKIDINEWMKIQNIEILPKLWCILKKDQAENWLSILRVECIWRPSLLMDTKVAKADEIFPFQLQFQRESNEKCQNFENGT